MQSTIKDILTSRAVWTALITLIGVLIMYYTNVPSEIWQSVAALMSVVVLKFTVDDLGVTIGRTIAKGLREGLEDK